MFISKNKLLFVLLFSLVFWNVQSAYSYHADAYKGRVKYGVYECLKDGKTCYFERYEGSATYHGEACPPYNRGDNYELHNEIMADFLNSQYCKFTPTKVKKYECKYDEGVATVYMENGKVKSASHSPNIKEKDLQNYYKPDKCVEREMEGDNGEPPIKAAQPKSISYGDDVNSPQGVYRMNSFSRNIQESVKKEIEPMQNEIKSLKDEIEIIKKNNTNTKNELLYHLIFMVITFLLVVVLLVTRNNRNTL